MRLESTQGRVLRAQLYSDSSQAGRSQFWGNQKLAAHISGILKVANLIRNATDQTVRTVNFEQFQNRV